MFKTNSLSRTEFGGHAPECIPVATGLSSWEQNMIFNQHETARKLPALVKRF